MGDNVGVVLPGIAEGEGVQPFPEKLGERVADEGGIAEIAKPAGDLGDDAQPVVDLPQKKDAGAGGDIRRLRAEFHRAVEVESEQRGG